MSKRQHLSGSFKRKLKEKRESANKKIRGSMMKYVVSESKAITSSSKHSSMSENTVDACSDIMQCVISNEACGTDVSNQCVLKVNPSPRPNDDLATYEKIKEHTELPLNQEVKLDKTNNTSPNVSEDPATWIEITEEMRDQFTDVAPTQNIELLETTKCLIGKNIRQLTANHFYRFKCNNEKVRREWLILSESSGAVFCWICKLFSKVPSALTTNGFCDWKHTTERLAEHENSRSHREAVCSMFQRKTSAARIDAKLVEQFQSECSYWYEVLKRVVAVTKFLARRGMAFFGQNETVGSPNNGNVLGCLELIAEFDPFLAKHLQKYGNPGSGYTNYLSSTTIDEFIDLMGTKVLQHIITEIKNAKYYSIIVDSTPDLTHTDQLSIVIRYVSSDCEPVERFLQFVPIYDHSSSNLANTVLHCIEKFGLDISDCRGQSYDNASNMSGKYNGLQARIKTLNPLAEFVPCSAHSLNLVGVHSVESNGKVLDFFTFLQELYNFFSHSTHRWNLLMNEIKSSQTIGFTLKSRSQTRWSANADATKAIRENYPEVGKILLNLSKDEHQTPTTRNEAKSLYGKLQKFETAILIVTWDSILQRMNKVSKFLQSPKVNLSEVPTLFNSLVDFVSFVRQNFEKYEDEALLLVGHKKYQTFRKRKVPRNKFLDDGIADEVVLEAKELFKVSCFYVLCDTLIMQLTKRKTAYDDIMGKFSCLFDRNVDTVHERAQTLKNFYTKDLEKDFDEEFVQFCSIVDKDDSVVDMLKKAKNTYGTFSNVETAFRIFLSLPVANCTSERSFSLLKRLKTPLRTLTKNEKLSSLAILCIENDITDLLQYDDIISDFTKKKVRRKVINFNKTSQVV